MSDRRTEIAPYIDRVLNVKPSYRGKASYLNVRQSLLDAQLAEPLAIQIAFEMIHIRYLDLQSPAERAAYLEQALGVNLDQNRLGAMDEAPHCLQVEAAFLSKNYALLASRGSSNPVNPQRWLEDLQKRAADYDIEVQIKEQSPLPTAPILDLL